MYRLNKYKVLNKKEKIQVKKTVSLDRQFTDVFNK